MKKLILTELLLFGMIGLQAQNSSEYNNNVPIGGTRCSAFGFGALPLGTATGVDNSAVGNSALNSNLSGNRNSAGGKSALYSNTNGNDNTAFGFEAMYWNVSGDRNTGAGTNAIRPTTGDENTGAGYNSMLVTSGTKNTGLGVMQSAVPHLHEQSGIGSGAVTNQTGHLMMGDANTSLFQGTPLSITSDGRFKEAISESDVKGIDFIKRLRPVTYNFDTRKYTDYITKNRPEEQRAWHLKKDFSKSTAIRRTGFLAQEVEKACMESGYDFSAVVKPQNECSTYGISYELFVVPLVKAIQEQQQVLSSYQDRIRQQRELLQRLNASTENTETSLSVNSDASLSIQVSFRLPGAAPDAFIGVYDLAGKEIVSYPLSSLNGSILSIAPGKLSEGMYTCSLIANGEIKRSATLVVEKD